MKDEHTWYDFKDVLKYKGQQIQQDIINQIDELFIKGLKEKGFEFGSKAELEDFAKRCCRVEDNVAIKERIYFVNDTPFLLHNYKIDIFKEELERKTTFKATSGYITLL